MISYWRRLLAEGIGTAGLLACIVGSGIMAVKLAQGNEAIALLANAGATAGFLYVLIVVFGPISGAHFNPVVSLALRFRGELTRRNTISYIIAQITGAIAGVLLAHAMFDLPLIQLGTHVRTGWGQWLSEAIATFGLLLTIILGARHRPEAVPALVASYIFAAYWFTASTSFANPAVTLARSLTQSFAGIRPEDVLGFLAAQLTGMLAAVVTSHALLSKLAKIDVDAQETSHA